MFLVVLRSHYATTSRILDECTTSVALTASTFGTEGIFTSGGDHIDCPKSKSHTSWRNSARVSSHNIHLGKELLLLYIHSSAFAFT